MLQMFSIFGALNFTIIPTLGAAAVENGIFCSSLLLFEDTQRTFWHVNLIFSKEEENKYANFQFCV